MTINYTTLLGLAEPVTGTQSGTWGDDVNKGITEYVDIAVAGTQTISGSQTAVTLSITNGSSAGNNIAQVGSGSTGSAQYQIINCTGNPASLLTITAPASSKTYVVINATSTSQSVKIVGAGPTTGVTIASGDKALVAWNGSDFVRVGASAGGSNTQIQYNNGGNLAGSANLTFDGSNVQIGSQGDLRFGDADNSNWVAFQAPATVASNITWTLPNADGSTGQVLSTNGSGALSWVAAGGSGSYTRTSFTATGGQTTFTVSYAVGYIEVFMNGVLLNAGDYTASNGTTVVLATGAAAGDIVETIAMNLNSIGSVAIGNITGATANGALYANSGGTVTSGTLPVGSGGTGAATLTGVLKGNGTSAFSAATAGTDFVAPGTATTFTATQTFSGSTSVLGAILTDTAEVCTVSATAATGTINYDVTTQSVLYYTTNASANWTVNFRGSSGTSLNTLMSTGQSLTVAFLVTQGATAYYNNAVQVDGNSVTPKYQGGTAWSAGNASSIDAYTYTIIKTGNAAFTVFAAQTQFK